MSHGAGRLQDVVRAMGRPLCETAWKIETVGFDRLAANGPAILAPNHISFLDSAFLMMLVPRRISFVGKAEYLDSWKTRWLFPAMGMIPIDRSGGDKSQEALETARHVLERGELFGIYPEGTRSRDGYLYKGKTGAARLALQIGCPLHPVGIVGTDAIQPPDAKVPKLRGSCRIEIGKPLELDKYRNRADDRLVLRAITDELMYEIRELTGQQYRDVYATKGASSDPRAQTRTAA